MHNYNDGPNLPVYYEAYVKCSSCMYRFFYTRKSSSDLFAHCEIICYQTFFNVYAFWHSRKTAPLKSDWHLTTNDTRDAVSEEDCELKVNCALCELRLNDTAFISDLILITVVKTTFSLSIKYNMTTCGS